MSLSTPSLMLLQINSGSNKLNKNITSVEASDFEDVNTQSEDAKSDTGSAQSSSGFIEEKVNNSLADSLTLSLIISICWSICTQSSVKYNVSDYFDNIQYDPLKKILKTNVITTKSLIFKSH